MKPVINVTPLIDVLLVLLIIFMVISPLKPSSFKARIPQPPTDDERVVPDPRTLVVSLDRDLGLRVNLEKQNATIDDPQPVIDRLREVFRQRAENYEATVGEEAGPSTTVFIKAPKTVGYGYVARVIDAVKSSGADPISLQIDSLD